MTTALPLHVSGVWEELARESVPRASYFGRHWGPAASWWGPGTDRQPLELDLVAESEEGELLVGEAKWQDAVDWTREVALLRDKAARLPLAQGRAVRLALWTKRRAPARARASDVACFTPRHVMKALR